MKDTLCECLQVEMHAFSLNHWQLPLETWCKWRTALYPARLHKLRGSIKCIKVDLCENSSKMSEMCETIPVHFTLKLEGLRLHESLDG